MALTDSIGRAIETSAPVLGAAFAEALLKKLPTPIPVKQVEEDQRIQEEIRDLLKEVEKKTGSGDDLLETSKAILDELRAMGSGSKKSATSSGGTSTRGKRSKSVTGTAAVAPGSPVMAPPGSKGAVAPMGGGGAGGVALPTAKGIANGIGLSTLAPMIVGAVVGSVGMAMDTLIRSTGIELGEMFSGIFADEFKFSKYMIKHIAETRELGQEVDVVTKKFTEFGGVVAQTGASRTAFQNAYLKSLKKGVQLEYSSGKLVRKNIGTQQQLLKNAMSTSYAIGTDAHQTAEMFDTWQRKLRLTKTELFQVGFSMRDIAQQTGVTSDALMEVAHSAEQVFSRMKESASLRFDTMGTVLQMLATASKYGVSDIMAEYAQGISSYSALLEMNNKKLQAAIFRGVAMHEDLVNSIRAGVGLEGGVYSDIVKRAQIPEMQRSLQAVGVPQGVNPMEMDKYVKKLQNEFLTIRESKDPADIARQREISTHLMSLDLVLKEFGYSIGQVSDFSKALTESARTAEEKITDLRDKLLNVKTDGARKQIEKDIKSIERGVSRQALSAYEDAMYSGSNEQEALKLAQMKFKGGGMEVKTMDDMQARVSEMFKGFEAINPTDVNSILKEQGFSSLADVQKGLFAGNEDDRAAARNAYEALENAMSTQDQMKDNPILEIQQKLLKVNEQIRDAITQSFVMSLNASTLSAIIVGALTIKFGAGVIGSIQTWRMFNGLMGRGAASAVGSGASSAVGAAGTAATAAPAHWMTSAMSKSSAPIAGAAPLAAEGGILSKIGAFFRGGKGAVAGGAKAGGKMALAANTAGIAYAVFAVIDGAMGAWDGYSKTAEVFSEKLKNADGSMKEVTTAMAVASTASGLLTGILNGLTFGLMDMAGWIEPLQKGLAQGIYFVFDMFGQMWDGIKEGVSSAWQTLKPAYDEIWGIIASIGPIVSDTFKDIGTLFNIDWGDWSKVGQSVLEGMKEFGRYLGDVIGVLMKMAVPVLKTMAYILVDVVKAVMGVVKAISGIVGFFFNIGKMILGAITFNGDLIKDGFNGMMNSVAMFVSGLAQALWNGFKVYFLSTLNLISSAIAGILSPLGEFGDFLTNLPSRMADGMLEGLKYAWRIFKEWATGGDITGQTNVTQIEQGTALTQTLTANANKEAQKQIDAAVDPIAKKAELEKALKNTRDQVKSAEMNLAESTKSFNENDTTWTRNVPFMGAGRDATKLMKESDETRLGTLKTQEAAITKQLEDLNANAKVQTEASDVTAKTMEMGQKKGSIYVHDTHCEALLIMILNALGKEWNEGAIQEQQALRGAIEERDKIETGMLETGAFQPREVKNAMILSDQGRMLAQGVNSAAQEPAPANKATEFHNSVVKSSSEELKKNIEKQTSTLINRGAFEERSVTQAFDYDDLEVRMAQLVGKDLNEVVDSVKDEMSTRPQGAATKALYMNQDDTDNIDTNLVKSFMSVNGGASSTSVNTNMFTPEDAADYVYQQMEGAKPPMAESTAVLDELLAEERIHTDLLREAVSELKKSNLMKNRPTYTSGGRGTRNKNDRASNTMDTYQRDLLRGNWEDLQAVSANSQDNLEIRPR